jgi:hypothetical protein
MTTNILSPNWTGDTAEPIDPTTIRFKAVRAPVYADCQGCLFIGQRSTVCRQASGQVDCDEAAPEGWSVIYVTDKSDPRQMDLLKAAESESC